MNFQKKEGHRPKVQRTVHPAVYSYSSSTASRCSAPTTNDQRYTTCIRRTRPTLGVTLISTVQYSTRGGEGTSALQLSQRTTSRTLQVPVCLPVSEGRLLAAVLRARVRAETRRDQTPKSFKFHKNKEQNIVVAADMPTFFV